MSNNMELLDAYMALAEDAFMSSNIQEAINNATMAKNLNPQSTTVLKSLAAYNIHLSAANKHRSKAERYCDVLEIKQGSVVDLETIKKSYLKLSLMVHPDKNKSVAAEGAFKLIGEAMEILSKDYEHIFNARTTTASDCYDPDWEEFKDCPYCGKLCILKKKNVSSQIFCSHCKKRFIFKQRRKMSSCSGWWSSIMIPCRAPPNGYGFRCQFG